MSRNPAFDQLLQELCDAVSQPSEIYGTAPVSAYQELAQSLTQDMLVTYETKDQDYASDGRPMGNLRGSESLGIPAWKAVLLRMNDKKQRIISFINRGRFEVQDEKLTDTLIDLANYSLLGLILFRESYDNWMPRLSHEMYESPRIWPAIKKTDAEFFNIAVCALRSKILYQLEATLNTDQKWDGENWEDLLQSFEQVAMFSRFSPTPVQD